MPEVKILTQKTEMLPLYPLIRQLSPGVSEEQFAFRLDDMLAHGYRMAAVFEGEVCLGLSGFWVSTKIYSGRYMELDNVVVSENHRSAGVGQILTLFLEKIARREGCEMLMLDAYLENERGHKFYERHGFVKKGYHFLKKI